MEGKADARVLLSCTWRQVWGRGPSSFCCCFPQQTNFPEDPYRKSLELKAALSFLSLTSECRPRRPVETLGGGGTRRLLVHDAAPPSHPRYPFRPSLMSLPLLHTNKAFLTDIWTALSSSRLGEASLGRRQTFPLLEKGCPLPWAASSIWLSLVLINP